MNKHALCWIGQRIIPAQDAKISVMDHGLLYGDGIFEGLRFYNKSVFKLEEHLLRLKQSATALSLELPYAFSEMIEIIQSLVKKYHFKDGYLRLVITRGEGNLGIDPQKCPKANMFIIADELKVVNASEREGIQVHIASTRRMPMDCLDPKIKSLNYLNNILARIEANTVGADEAVMLNAQGFVTEGSVDNIFIVTQGVLQTPPVSAGILAGITRECIIDVAQVLKIKTEEKNLTVYDLLNADECFLTGTGAELIPVKTINKQLIEGTSKPLFHKIEKQFAAYIQSVC